MASAKSEAKGDSSQLQKYYASLESRIGYRLFLGGTRHFGYYENAQASPFPIGSSLRRMEDKLFQSLGVASGAEVVDAGCGIGHVAIHGAQKGLRVHALDIVKKHLVKARRNVAAAGVEDKVRLDEADYHDLSLLDDNKYDGLYTMETFVHATDPAKALGEFHRKLKPGGRLALFEYDHPAVDKLPTDIQQYMKFVNEHAAMQANQMFEEGILEALLKDAGFDDVKIEDISANIMPMLWLFYIVAIIPYTIIKLLGLQKHFINTMAGAEGYPAMKKGYARYVVVTARKPGNEALVATSGA